MLEPDLTNNLNNMFYKYEKYYQKDIQYSLFLSLVSYFNSRTSNR